MVPPGRVLRQLDLGFHSMMADMMFIRANLYYGKHILTDEQLPWLDNFNDVLLDLDPDFKKAYFWAAMVTGSIPDSEVSVRLNGSYSE